MARMTDTLAGLLKRRGLPRLDFVPPTDQAARLGWWLLAAGMLVASWTAADAAALWQRQVAVQQALRLPQARDTGTEAAPSAPRAGPASPSMRLSPADLERSRVAAWRAEQVLAYPWPQRWALLDQPEPGGVRWLRLQAERTAPWRLEGHAPSPDAALAMVEALRQAGAGSGTRLTRLEAVDAAWRFEVVLEEAVRVAAPRVNTAVRGTKVSP
ncbi:MAG: hypothetical protein ACKVQR_06005 [Aquabacterium sp.]